MIRTAPAANGLPASIQPGLAGRPIRLALAAARTDIPLPKQSGDVLYGSGFARQHDVCRGVHLQERRHARLQLGEMAIVLEASEEVGVIELQLLYDGLGLGESLKLQTTSVPPARTRD